MAEDARERATGSDFEVTRHPAPAVPIRELGLAIAGSLLEPILEELGLTYTQYIAIVALWEEDNQTVSGLGEKLFLESNTLTPILKKLEGMGYLRRQRDPLDERQVLIRLTDAGRKLREKGLNMNLVKESGLPPEEFAKVQKAVVTLRNNLIKAAHGAR